MYALWSTLDDIILIFETVVGLQTQWKSTRSKHCIKGSKECLIIRTLTHSLQIFEVIPFVKQQNDT